MSGVAEISGLVGREVRGVVPLASGSLAISFVGAPRVFLWIHLERKTAWYAVAADLPVDPDPRGSRFQAIETPLRRTVLAEERAREAGGLDLRFDSAEEGKGYRLTLDAEGPRVNLSLTMEPEGTTLWAFHREERTESPPGFRAPVVRDATPPEERLALRARIQAAFLAEFRADVERMLKSAERTLLRRAAGAEQDVRNAAEMRGDRRRAEILLSHFGKIQRGASRVGLPDPFADSPRATVEIDLDPSLSPDENAARLFQRAKKGERGEQLASDRLTETRKRLSELSGLRRDALLITPKALQLARSRGSQDRTSARGRHARTHLVDRPSPRPVRDVRRGTPGAHSRSGQDVRYERAGKSGSGEAAPTTTSSPIGYQPHDFWFRQHIPQILRRPTQTPTDRRIVRHSDRALRG